MHNTLSQFPSLARRLVLALALLAWLAPVRGLPISPAAAQAPAPDPAAVTLLNSFLTALSVVNEQARIEACLPLLHVSLLTDDRRDLSPDVKRYQFKKASQAAGEYANPVTVTRIRERGTLTVDEGGTPEKGRVDDYFIARKDGQDGLPAPVQIFFPANGGPPRIFYMGSL